LLFISTLDHLAYGNGLLSISQRRGIITLIPKPNKDTNSLHNLRPISLLNTDYKILTKVIAERLERLEKVLLKVINRGSIWIHKRRYIGESVRLISGGIPGIDLFIDFKNALDTIEWDFLNSCLEVFNSGGDRSVILYNNVSSCIINNGFGSEFFSLKRSIQKGCPLSGCYS